MVRVTVLYPKTENSHFDKEYYLSKHVPLVNDRLAGTGFQGISVDEGVASGTPGQPLGFAAIAYLLFESMEAVQQGLGQHGPELMGDIPNFTDVQPQVQINNIIHS
jgi:uncharacterized protein (TIGR02118 family)